MGGGGEREAGGRLDEWSSSLPLPSSLLLPRALYWAKGAECCWVLGKGKMVRWMLAEEGRETAAEVGREKDADTGREKLDAERRSVLSSRCLSQGWMGLCGRREVLRFFMMLCFFAF